MKGARVCVPSDGGAGGGELDPWFILSEQHPSCLLREPILYYIIHTDTHTHTQRSREGEKEEVELGNLSALFIGEAFHFQCLRE